MCVCVCRQTDAWSGPRQAAVGRRGRRLPRPVPARSAGPQLRRPAAPLAGAALRATDGRTGAALCAAGSRT